MTSDDSARRAELLAKLVDYSRAHGLADMSLRPLAAAVGSSPRVLLYFFTSKDQLVREVVAHSRREQVELVQAELTVPATDDAAGEPAGRSAVDRLWQWLTDPDNAHVERLFFESYALSLRAEPGAWEGYGAASVAEWLPQLRPVAERLMPGADPDVAATLLLATVRGLLLDRLATGDSWRTDRAMTMFLRGLDGTALTAD